MSPSQKIAIPPHDIPLSSTYRGCPLLSTPLAILSRSLIKASQAGKSKPRFPLALMAAAYMYHNSFRLINQSLIHSLKQQVKYTRTHIHMHPFSYTCTRLFVYAYTCKGPLCESSHSLAPATSLTSRLRTISSDYVFALPTNIVLLLLLK